MTPDQKQRISYLKSLDAGNREVHSIAMWRLVDSLERLSDVYPGLEELIESTLYLLEANAAEHRVNNPFAWF